MMLMSETVTSEETEPYEPVQNTLCEPEERVYTYDRNAMASRASIVREGDICSFIDSKAIVLNKG